MKYAIAANGQGVDDYVSERGGRAPYYIIVQGEEVVEVIKNPFAMGAGGAGFSVAYLLGEKGVEKVFAPSLGDNMVFALGEKNIEYCEVSSEKKISEIIAENKD